jgi:AraC family transcriptional regulator, transcriptional activator of pobA
MPQSLAPTTVARPAGRWVDGAPVYEFVRSPVAPPVSVLRFPAGELPEVHRRLDHAHVHDFLVLAYFEHGAGHLRLGTREWPLSSGDAFVIAPGELVRFSGHEPGRAAAGWCVFFPPELIAAEPLGGALGWRAHPLLYRFVGRQAGGAQRLPVPAGERAAWSERAQAIEAELREPRDGSAEAALAHLTLLLVSAARISVDVGQDLRQHREPLLAAVFELIEARYAEPVSLASIAAEVGLTPGHLTTVVRRKTGRSVQRWITERRMAEARRLLRESDLTVETVAARTGYRQASYFIKQFRRDHSVTPAAWRQQAQAS